MNIDVLDSLIRTVGAVGVPLALIVILYILKPIIAKFIENVTKFSTAGVEVKFDKDFHLDVGEGQVGDGVVTFQAGGDLIRQLEEQPKEKIEKLRIYMETEQIKQSIKYHNTTLAQSTISFWFSIGAATAGFFVIILGVMLFSFSANQTAAYVSIVSGAIIDAVAALFFTQSNQARRLLTEFFDKLRTDRKFNEALRLCESIPDARMRSILMMRLSLFFAGATDGANVQLDPAELAIVRGQISDPPLSQSLKEKVPAENNSESASAPGRANKQNSD